MDQSLTFRKRVYTFKLHLCFESVKEFRLFSITVTIPQRHVPRKIQFQKHLSRKTLYDIIKIMPCVEGDRSDCQPKASSIARSRRLRAMVVVEGWQSDLSPQHRAWLFLLHRKSIVHLPCLSLYFRPICKMQRIEHELVHGFSNNSLPCKQVTTTFSPLLLVSTQPVNVSLLQNEFAARYR